MFGIGMYRAKVIELQSELLVVRERNKELQLRIIELEIVIKFLPQAETVLRRKDNELLNMVLPALEELCILTSHTIQGEHWKKLYQQLLTQWQKDE